LLPSEEEGGEDRRNSNPPKLLVAKGKKVTYTNILKKSSMAEGERWVS
jgi:hypothetical protein